MPEASNPMPRPTVIPEVLYLVGLKPLDEDRWVVELRYPGGGTTKYTVPRDAVVGATWGRLQEALLRVTDRKLTCAYVAGVPGPESYYRAGHPLTAWQTPELAARPAVADGIMTSSKVTKDIFGRQTR